MHFEMESRDVIDKDAIDNGCNEQLFVQKLRALESKIPKYVVSFDEKYVFSCLEWMLKEERVLRDNGYDTYHTLKSSASASSSGSDKSSSCIVSDVVSQGMLKCTWKNGIPNDMFSVDDLGEVYVAKILSPKDKCMDYVCNFYSKQCGKKEMKLNEVELNFVGKMEVSTCVTFISNNEEILETRFVLYGIEENSMPLNIELAAIVVRSHVYDTPKKQEIAGWGLKFLKNSDHLLEETCAYSECSTSMNILVPAGCHGGTRTRKNWPSSIVDRWISGGHCDCGGWDVGCPLTVINTGPNQLEKSPSLDHAGDCKAVDLFVKGSKESSPIMRITNIDEDLYYIYFHSTLSSLQCFSIATAIIHNKTPYLTSKLCKN